MQNQKMILKLYDRSGKELKLGDIVKISNGHTFKFYAKVKYLEKLGIITPFHTFSFHSFTRVNNLPQNAIPAKDSNLDYELWYVPDDFVEKDKAAEQFHKYLSEWRQCEHLIDNRVYRIELE